MVDLCVCKEHGPHHVTGQQLKSAQSKVKYGSDLSDVLLSVHDYDIYKPTVDFPRGEWVHTMQFWWELH